MTDPASRFLPPTNDGPRNDGPRSEPGLVGSVAGHAVKGLVAGVAVALLVLAALAATKALAQSGGSAIQIEADTIDYRPGERLALLSGNAVVVQGPTVLRSNTLRIIYRAGGQQIERVQADQEVFFSRGDQRVRGDRGVLDAGANTITITGNVVVTHGRNVLQGQQLVFNTATNASTMRGLDGRVRAVFFQDN
jgi:lipopolysaccharide export system protein LptA